MIHLKGKPRSYRVLLGLLGYTALAALGLITLQNADFYSGATFHTTQTIWLLAGGMLALLVSRIDLDLFSQAAWLLFGASVLLLILVLGFGSEFNHSTRWIKLFGITGQPSELAKVTLVLALARYFQNTRTTERFTLRTLWLPFLLMAVPAGLILVQPDLGTTLCMLFVGVSVILFAGVRLKSFLILLGIVVLMVPIAWKFNLIRSYQKDRVVLWLIPEAFVWDAKNRDLLGKNLQPERARWAIGSGRLTGKGGREGSQVRLKHLPEMETDFILATYGEERGFVGCFFLVALYYLMFLWALALARDARDRFSALVSVGTGALIFSQAFINIGMVTGMLPVVGITLPFMSYGGSALLSAFFAVGLQFNIARNAVRS